MSEPIAIPLRRKYSAIKHCKQQKSSGGSSGKKHRDKLNGEAKRRLAPQPEMVMMVDGRSGHAAMKVVIHVGG